MDKHNDLLRIKMRDAEYTYICDSSTRQLKNGVTTPGQSTLQDAQRCVRDDRMSMNCRLRIEEETVADRVKTPSRTPAAGTGGKRSTPVGQTVCNPRFEQGVPRKRTGSAICCHPHTQPRLATILYFLTVRC
jgi:hypothetical protein